MTQYAQAHGNKEKKNITGKIILYAVLSIIILLTWSFLGPAIVFITGAYMTYKFVRLALGGFGCPHCWFGFLIAMGLFTVSLFALSNQAAFLPVIFLWVLGFTGGKHRG